MTRRSKSGPPPIYATSACRMRALRQRRIMTELEPLPDLVKAGPIKVHAAGIDDQIARSILEARAIGYAFQRLGTRARVDLAWRCTKLGQAIETAINETFPLNERQP